MWVASCQGLESWAVGKRRAPAKHSGVYCFLLPPGNAMGPPSSRFFCGHALPLGQLASLGTVSQNKPSSLPYIAFP